MKPQLGSSKGFTKRTLLRPASSLSREREFLKTVDISQSEPMISSTIRSQLSVIQQSINLLDKDKKIRGGQVNLEKSYITVLKKWIKENGSLASQLQKEDDDGKILKYMGVENYQTGFRKLWKIICNLDLMISKVMELQIVHLVKYDDLFSKIGEDSEVAGSMLSVIAKSGFNPAMFHVVRIQLERSNELFAHVAQGNRKEATGQKQSFTTQNQTNQLIQQLQSQNRKLATMLEQFEKQKTHTPKTQSIKQSTSSANNSLKDIENKYEQYIGDLTSKISKYQEQLTEKKIKINSINKEIDMLKKQHESGQSGAFKKTTTTSGSFQQALMEQMQKMKTGFERKIKNLLQQQQQFERDTRKRQYQLKIENDRIKWQKSLLLKKFDMISK